MTIKTITKKEVVLRTAKGISIDALKGLGNLARIASMPVIGQLPRALKHRIYDESICREYDTRLSTIIARYTNVLAGAATGVYLADGGIIESGLGGAFGAILGLGTNLHDAFAKKPEFNPKQAYANSRGSLHGYVMGVPVSAGLKLYDACKDGIENVGKRYQNAQSELEKELEGIRDQRSEGMEK